jgi:hypothetical protein
MQQLLHYSYVYTLIGGLDMLVIEALDSKGFGFKAGGVWYNVPKGTQIPPKGSVVAGQVMQGLDKAGRPRYTIQGMYVVQQSAQPAQAQPAQAYNKPAYSKPTQAGSYNSGRGEHDTTAEQKLRYNALTLAIAFDKGGSVDSMVAVAGQLYEVIKSGFIPAQMPVQQAAVQQRMQPAPAQQPAQYSAFQQPSFDDDDLPFQG